MNPHNSLRIINANLFTPLGTHALHGSRMGQLHHIASATVDVVDGVITYVGPGASAPAEAPAKVFDAEGRALLPGFIDSHTHAIFGGYRADEFGWRMRGDSYMSIMERGGGIVSTVDATRHASEQELVDKTRYYLRQMSRMGVTTVEIKSGYGLDTESELMLLRAIRKLAEMPDREVDVEATFMGAHAVPREMAGRTDEYVDRIISEMLPRVEAEGLARHCDVFCERGVFSVDQSRRLLEAARRHGLLPRIHADEMADTGGARFASEIGALSADHLLHVSPDGIAALAASDTVATLLPLTAFTLREPYAPARALIDAGAAVALATDFNPGSCMSCSIPLMIALACIYMGMNVEEVVTALTLNGAAALGIADLTGSIEVGKQADMALLAYDSPAFLPYYTAMNCVVKTIKHGVFIEN